MSPLASWSLVLAFVLGWLAVSFLVGVAVGRLFRRQDPHMSQVWLERQRKQGRW